MLATELGPGSVVAGHRIESVINSGGMGIVFSAVDTELERRVAFKIIKPELAADEQFRRRFQREAKLMASIDHPNIIQIWRCGEEDGLLFVSMQYVEGTDLAAVIRELGRLPTLRAARIVADVAAALDVAHRYGVVHRDVKPHNILLEQRPEDERVVLTDFGLAKRVRKSRSEMFRTREFIGTPAYAAPEQMRPKRVDARADIYALGGVLFHAVTGRVPFDADDEVGLLIAHATAPPPRVTAVVSDVPRDLDSIVEKALAKNPADRYDSAGDLAQAVLAASGQGPIADPLGNVATGAAAPGGAEVESPPPSAETDEAVTPPTGVPAAAQSQVREILRRAESHRARHRNTSALEEFERALQLAPESADALAGRGHTYLSERRIEDALADFEAALRKEPGSIYALTGRAAARLAKRQPESALQDYKSALAIDPGSLDALVGCAETLTRLRQYSAARAAVESALSIDSDAVDGLRLRAVLAVQSRQLAAARAAATHAVEVDPHSPAVFATRAFVRLAAPDLEGALEDVEKACTLDDCDASTRALRGLVLVRLGRADEGLGDLEHAIGLDGEHAEARAWRAVATLWLGRSDDVDADVQRALELHSECGSAYLASALQRLRAGEAKKALMHLDRALELDRAGVTTWFGRDRVHLWRAEISLNLGRFIEAIADSEHALKEAPDSAEAHLIRSRALLRLGRAGDALEDVEAAWALDRSPQILLRRSEALFALGRYGEAVADLEAAAAAAPASDEVVAARRRAALDLPLTPEAEEATGPAFSELLQALDAKHIDHADQCSMAIIRAAAGRDQINSEASATAVEDRVLLKLDAMWRATGAGSVRHRPWVRAPELSTNRGILRGSWLSWRMRSVGV
jgi:serine/threonine protein kinase/Tfp pilus assembly protein PilF